MRIPSSLPRTVCLVLLVLGTLGLASTAAFADHTMPDLTGRSEDDAVRELEALGLDVRVMTIADASPGRVAYQLPAAGTAVREGDAAELHVGVGVDVMTQAPRVVGLREERVLRHLADLYRVVVEHVDVLDGGRRGKPTPWLSSGRVVSQSPAPGQPLKYRGTLEITVFRARPRVPLLVGRSLEEAQGLLEQAGLDAQVRTVPVTWAERGTVVGQEPQAGARLAPGGLVEVRVAGRERGRHPGRGVRVPDLVGVELVEAEDTLIASGLMPHVHFEDRGTGRPLTVLSQEVEAGRRLAPGAHVGITVSRPLHTGLRVRVPILYGVERAEALDLLGHMGLTPRVVEQPSVFPAGTVVGQDLEPGRVVAPRAPITLTIASAPTRGWRPPHVAVPRAIGLTPSQAYIVMRRAGFAVRMERALGADQPVGLVFSQSRPAGSRAGQASEIILALPLVATVPALTGLTHHQALRVLQEAGLQGLGRREGPGGPRAVSKVIAQDHPADQVIARGSVVQFRYRMHAAPAPLRPVPEVIGLTHTAAEARLRALGFNPELRSAVAGGGGATRVVSQSPSAGSLRPVGHQVIVTYRYVAGGGPAYVRVPRVLGMNRGDASRQLAAAGLGVRAVRQGPTSTVGGTSTVIAQSPTGGTAVPRGTAVTITYRVVPRGASLVRVPDVVGHRVDRAVDAMRRAGLAISVRGVGTRVRSQTPVANSYVPRGTAIVLTLR